MNLYFEGYKYSDSEIKGISRSLYYPTKKGNSFRYIGYYLPESGGEPALILPKVFLKSEFNGSKEELLTFQGLEPNQFVRFSEVIDDEKDPLKLGQVRRGELKELVYGISTWIYRSIKHYIEGLENSELVEESNLQNVINACDQGTSNTYLDIVMALFKFAHQHKNLMTFITRLNRSGMNKIDWTRTVTHVQPVFQDNTPVYLNTVNKKKSINFDEQLIVLFYSVLNYLHETVTFPYEKVVNYELLRPFEIENMISSGSGTRLLRKIHYKYFTDELVQLWNLLFIYFDKAERIKSNRNSEEMLLVHDYDRVFEDMVDQLIGDDLLDIKKKQQDGKILDHLYKYQDLHNADYIYYIADSKYYIDSNDLSSESLFKQFTYAKDIIQYNIDRYYEGKLDESIRYRDEETEGYNITPNFFIRGSVGQDELNDTSHLRLIARKDGYQFNYQFENRLFDRDTLPTQEYSINFMFVLAAYVANSQDNNLKSQIHEQFKRELTAAINSRYVFYELKAKNGWSLDFLIKDWFKELHGKIYKIRKEDEFRLLALDKSDVSYGYNLLEDSKFNFCFSHERASLGNAIQNHPLYLRIEYLYKKNKKTDTRTVIILSIEDDRIAGIFNNRVGKFIRFSPVYRCGYKLPNFLIDFSRFDGLSSYIQLNASYINQLTSLIKDPNCSCIIQDAIADFNGFYSLLRKEDRLL